MKKILKFGSFLLALLLTVQFVAPAYAAAVPPPERAPRGEWRYEYDEPYMRLSQFYEASGQPEDGYVFRSGGYIGYTPSGGGTVSVSIGLATGKTISVNTQLGVAFQSGGVTSQGSNVPADSKHAYKLYVAFVYKITPYRSYYRETKNDPWKLFVSSQIVEVTQWQCESRICGPAYG